MANARRSNFDLNKSVNLRDIDLQGKELKRQKSAGLRDIGQAREEGLQAAVNNALQRGIFRSGITVENKGRVNREADEAGTDLRGRIGISLDRLANRRRGEAGRQFAAGGDGGGSMADIIADFIRWLDERNAPPPVEPIDFPDPRDQPGF